MTMTIEEKEPRAIAERLISALQEDEFVLYAQEIVALDPTLEDWPFQEIFVRFSEEDEKLLPPGSFFPVLEEFDLLPYLDRWVVNRLARWVRSGLGIRPDWKIPRSNVNLSRVTLEDPDFGTYVRRYVDDSFLSNGVLAFEVSWRDAVELPGELTTLMKGLRPFGCGFTLAGFDGSKEAFSIVKAVAPDFVKISPAVAAGAHSNPALADRTSEISTRSRAMNIKTIAEQVEHAGALDQLRKAKVDYVQGYQIAPVRAL
jgi:EAL domain-containing protein (putative c-di-GMP-specific phosphodiesterase class I)